MIKTELIEAMRACTECSIGRLGQRQNVVPGWLGTEATTPLLAVMCEAPGAQEDSTGRPLVGKAGQLFDRLLISAGLDRKNLLLMNRVRCRPTNNSLKAHPDALGKCDPWTVAELELYNPKVVVLMGATAMENVFGTKVKVGPNRGVVRKTGPEFEYGERTWIGTYHPASLLRPGGQVNMPLVIADLALAKTFL